jgi:hypothetical protein
MGCGSCSAFVVCDDKPCFLSPIKVEKVKMNRKEWSTGFAGGYNLREASSRHVNNKRTSSSRVGSSTVSDDN